LQGLFPEQSAIYFGAFVERALQICLVPATPCL
jgi:hypothetical protein